MINSIPFSIPTEFAAGLNDGSLVRIGTLIKETGTGKIIAHVQETGLGQHLLNGVGASPFSPLTLASTGYANVQLEQLKSMMEGLQILQYANLGVSLAGIGVSSIGFAIINKKLKNIGIQISDLSKKMDQHFQDLIENDLREHYSKVATLFEKAELAHELTNSTDEWKEVSSQLADESGFFRGRIERLLEHNKFDMNLFTAFVRYLTLCNAGRIECLLLADELPAAHKAADMVGHNYKDLFDDIVPFQIARKLAQNETSKNTMHYRKIRQHQKTTTNDLVQGIRDITDAALTKPLLIKSLIENNIAGSDYISALRNEKEHPLLLLRHKGNE